MFKKLKAAKNAISTVKEGTATVKELAEVAHGFADTKEEKRDFYLEAQDHAAEERAEDRKFYQEQKEKFLHNFAAIMLLSLWAVCTVAFIVLVASGKFRELSAYESGIIAAIQTLITREVSGLYGFLFGGNEAANKSAKSLYEANNPADNKRQRHERKLARIEAKK